MKIWIFRVKWFREIDIIYLIEWFKAREDDKREINCKKSITKRKKLAEVKEGKVFLSQRTEELLLFFLHTLSMGVGTEKMAKRF
jgi:hypothetical protein